MPVTPTSVYVLISTCLTTVTAVHPGADVNRSVTSVRTEPVSAPTVIV